MTSTTQFNQNKPFDLEDRTIAFANEVLVFIEDCTYYEPTVILTKQLMRSATSVALNYAEAQESESRKDFVHKMKITMKELRESQVCLRLICLRPNIQEDKVEPILDECNQLLRIFSKSVKTVKSKTRLPQN